MEEVSDEFFQMANEAEEYATMGFSTSETRVVPLLPSKDVLTDILRQGAQQLLAQAIEAEVQAWIEQRTDYRDERGRQQVVRNGHMKERTLLTGVGPVQVEQPRVRDRRPPRDREKFSSAILPPYLRKTKSVEELIPWLYLKGISTGDFSEALEALLGPDAKGLSATTVTRLKGIWQDEYAAWSKRSLVGKRYVYVWADGVHFNIRLEDERQCILVLMGVTPEGDKEIIAISEGYRESEQSWRALLLDCKERGLEIDPELQPLGVAGHGLAIEAEFARDAPVRPALLQKCLDCLDIRHLELIRHRRPLQVGTWR